MVHKYVLMFNKLSLGGTETLIFRISEWLRNSDCNEVTVICEEITEKSVEDDLLNKGINIECIKPINIKNLTEYIEKNPPFDNLTFIVFQSNHITLLERICMKSSSYKTIKRALYIVHPMTFIKGDNIKNKHIQNVVKNLYKGIISNFLDENKIIFMDSNTKNSILNYYKLNNWYKESIIVKLPMKINECDFERIQQKSEKKEFNLLTIARADFPFKGYLIGLVDDFVELQRHYPLLTLTIISHGKQIELLSDKINKLSSEIQAKIRLIGKVEYGNLKTYFEKANLYIGMGTTILDSAVNGVPSIVAHSYTYNNTASGFFHDNPEILDTSKTSLEAKQLIESVLKMNSIEYIDLCKKSYKSVNENYNINTNMTLLMKRINTSRTRKRISVYFLLKIDEIFNTLKRVK